MNYRKGFVYFMSNPEYPGRIKVGKTKEDPVIRAKVLSRQTATLGEYKVEWKMEVPEMTVAEIILHYKLREWHYDKEFYKIEVSKAIEIAKNALTNFFRDEIKKEKIKKTKEKANKRIKGLKKITLT